MPQGTASGRRAVRLRAILCALWFGIIPWWVYEEERHYPEPYLEHLWLNLVYAAHWALGRQTLGDVRFELENN